MATLKGRLLLLRPTSLPPNDRSAGRARRDLIAWRSRHTSKYRARPRPGFFVDLGGGIFHLPERNKDNGCTRTGTGGLFDGRNPEPADIVVESVCRCYVQIWSRRNMSDDDESAVAVQSLSDAQLIQILQLCGYDDDITQMVEAEIARRKKEGGRH
jgi:hypothetical protein